MGTGLHSEQLLLLEHGHHTRMLQTTQGLCPTSSSSTPSPPRSAWQSMQVLSRRNVCIGALDGSLLAALTGRAPSHQVAVLHNTSGTPHRQPTAERASAPGLRLRASTRTAAAPRAHGTASSPSTEPAVLGSRCACQDPGRSPTCCRGLGSFHTAEACWRHEGRRLPGRTVSPTPSASIKASRPSHAQRAAPPARHEGPLPAHGTAAARQLPRRKGRPAGTQPPRPAHGPAGGAVRLPAHPAGQDGTRQAQTRRPPRWAQPRSAATSRSAPLRSPPPARGRTGPAPTHLPCRAAPTDSRAPARSERTAMLPGPPAARPATTAPGAPRAAPPRPPRVVLPWCPACRGGRGLGLQAGSCPEPRRGSCRGRKLAAPNPRPHCDVRGSVPLPPQCKAALAFHCKQEEQHQSAPCSQGRAVPVPVVLLQAADRGIKGEQAAEGNRGSSEHRWAVGALLSLAHRPGPSLFVPLPCFYLC